MDEESLGTLVLAFDLDTHEAGWVLMDSNDEILHLGYWKAPKGNLDIRLRDLMFSLEREAGWILSEGFWGRRILVAYEAPHAQYAKPVLALGQAVGILKTVVWRTREETKGFLPLLAEISIAEAKFALTGRGNANKKMVLNMARKLSGCKELNQHQADAYGVACAAWGKLHQKAMLEMARGESDE